MDPQSSIDDCYFYYYSSCIKGAECQFRHCEAALGTETVCSLWKEGRCFRDNCKFRHMESRIQRSAIPCYWENQPGGCRKPHCVFFHSKYRRDTSSENKKLILPVSNQGPTLVPNPTMGSLPSDVLKTPNYSNVDSLFTNENLSLSPASQPVEPVVVTLDEGEESDAESVSSAPMKSVQVKTDVRTSKDAEEKDFGVKTLEQLRMEKIHRESEHFYKSDDVSDAKVMAGNNRNSSLHEDSEMYFSDYCMPSHEDMQLDHKSESNVYKNFYPPDSSDVIILPDCPSPEENNSVSGVVGLRSESLPSIRGDLRSRIKKNMGEQQTAAQEKRTLSLKRKSDPEEDSFDFKIKTLDEIRKEKLKKADESSTSKSPPPAYELTELQQALDNRRKIRKLFRDPFTAHKEEREVQKSLEQKLRIDPINTIRNGSINGLPAEVLVKAESCPKTGGTVKNFTTLSDDEDAIPTNKTKEDSGKSSLHSQNHGLSALKNGNISNAANITLSRKLRPITRNKKTSDPVVATADVEKTKGNLPTNDSVIHTGTSASKQNISPTDEHMTPSPKQPLVTNTDSDDINMSNDDKPDIENQHLLNDKQNVDDRHLPCNKPASDDQLTVLDDKAPPVESTSTIEQKVEPMNIAAEPSTSVDNFNDSFFKDKLNVEDQHLPGNNSASSDQQTVSGDKVLPVESTSTIEQKVEPMNVVTQRSTSVDDFDNLFLNDSDMMLEESEAEHSDKKAEDIFLEIEQMLDS